ncbi:MAG: hypothetical protein JWP95_1955 [Actinotalea sp.]|jgi:hypothetical protein|nr:hypothetical protein [Actinotalea sp.]
MISTIIRLRGGPADGSLHEVAGRVAVGREIRVSDVAAPDASDAPPTAVYLVAAVEPGPLFDVPEPVAMEARADYVGRG